MTVAELTTIRTNALACLNGTLERGVSAYGLDGRQLTAYSPEQLLALVERVDGLIAKASGGGSFSKARFMPTR